MEKSFLQFLITIALFFTIWFGLSKIEWRTVLHIEKVSQTTEEKLGDLFWTLYKTTENEIHTKKIIGPVDSLLNTICIKNNFDRSEIKLHVLLKDEVNAYTLPDQHLVVFSGLITSCKNESELCGILAHELAHMKKNHVMKKLIKEVGLSALISIVTGNKAGSQAIKELAKTITSTAYDRDLEREADMTGVEYLIKANINPEAFADFLFILAKETENIPIEAYWISTHPNSEERAEAILEVIKSKQITTEQILANSTWNSLLERINDEN